MQRNWIGRSEGARVKFRGRGRAEHDRASTCSPRASTRSSARRSCCSRPEHPLVATFAETSADPAAFRKQAQDVPHCRTAPRAISGEIEKQGFDTGCRAINPFTNKPVPIWVANFVLGEYGTGAVMAVPAHDQRDFEFARKFDLPIRGRRSRRTARPASMRTR